MTEKKLKELLFEIFSAGFEAGYAQDIDLVTAFEKWFATMQDAQV